MVALLWLVSLVVGMFIWARRDARIYEQFRALADTRARQQFYWRWTAESFVLLGGGSLVTLWLLGRLEAIAALPAEFRPITALLKPDMAARSFDEWLPMALGMATGVALIAFIQWRRLRRLMMPTVGDIQPLLPRNRAERLVAIPLSINAGISEELFFRLALPLLIAHVTGSVMVALIGAGILFGLLHLYQGWKGVLGTAAVGGFLTVQYLAHGSLVRVMVIHAVIDLVAFVVRPALSQWLDARRQIPAAGLA